MANNKRLSPLEYAEKAAGDRSWDRKIASDVKQQRSINKLGEIVEKHGKGSRKGQEAIKKFIKYYKGSGPGTAKSARKVRKAEDTEDMDLIRQYGADAMQAKGFGTTYPKVKRNIGGLVKKRKKKRKVFSGTDYVKEVNNYKII